MCRRAACHKTGLAANHVAYPDVFFDLRQNYGFSGVSTTIPTLLRGSQISAFAANRTLLPAEHFESMGYAIYSSPQVSFAESVERLGYAQMRSLAGNGMHAAASGTILIFALSGVQRMQPQHP